MSGAHRKMGSSAWPPTRERLDPTWSPRVPYEARHQAPPESADCTPTVIAGNPYVEQFRGWGPLDIPSDRVTLVLRVSRAAVSERLDPTWSPQKAEALAEIEAALHLACRQALGLGGNGGDVLC